ncbi:hypothetical protein DPMN_089744 [Dreissena polymorpha]|uniref:RING-type domain-containing protein n=1 Tax=Dreissena polymorpha TaxID=45954 RepID=A0A9D4QYD5_DREPO|nr:hypothetical protein DPMN_089744 [Dreissena polymorpha]
MVSKQLAGVGLCLDDESHPLYLTPSELNQTCQNVHSLLKMRDEKADKQYHLQKNEEKEAADFIAQLVQQNSNDSSGSSSTKNSNKRKAIGDSEGHTVKKPKGSRNAKQNAISSENKQTDFVEQYLKKQQKIKSLHADARTRIAFIEKSLQYVQSKESDEPTVCSFLSEASSNISHAIESISSELQNSGDVDSCRICKNEDNPPTVISKTCGHGFCCMKCIMKYLEYVYNKNSGRLICLKCKHPYDENATYQVGSRYGIIG